MKDYRHYRVMPIAQKSDIVHTKSQQKCIQLSFIVKQEILRMSADGYHISKASLMRRNKACDGRESLQTSLTSRIHRIPAHIAYGSNTIAEIRTYQYRDRLRARNRYYDMLGLNFRPASGALRYFL